MKNSNRPANRNGRQDASHSEQNRRVRPASAENGRSSRISPEKQKQYEANMRRRAAKKRLTRMRAAEQQRNRELEKQRKLAERQEKRRIFKGRFAFFAIVFAAVLLAAAGLLLLVFNRAPDKARENGLLVYTYGGETIRTCKRSECMKDGILYFCFNDLSDYLGLAESGSAQKMKFIFPTDTAQVSSAGTGREEYVVFYTGSTDISVGGQMIRSDIPNRLIGTEVWVSVTFAEKYMTNLSVRYDEANGILRFARVIDEDKTAAAKAAAMAKANGLPESKVKWDTYYYDVDLLLKPTVTSSPLTENNVLDSLLSQSGDSYNLDLMSDLSEYEPFMNPTGSMKDSFLVLVNEDRKAPADSVPGDLTDVIYTSYTKPTQQMRLYAAKALEALFIEMYARGFYNMAVYTGYRSYEYQASLFEEAVQTALSDNPELTREEAELVARKTEFRAGESEHQTGLAADMDTFGSFSMTFAETDEFAWLSANAWKFGFILRYPEDKTTLTGEPFEPWHFRYVGRYHAKIMHDSGLCLEEYSLLLSSQK